MRLTHPIIVSTFLFFYSTFVFSTQLIVEPEMGREPILNAILAAKYNIDLVIYGFTDRVLLNALVKSHQLGRSVKVLIEEMPFRAQEENIKAIRIFDSYNIKWKGTIPPYHLIHQKTLIIDNQLAMVLTFNFTHSTFQKQRNFGLVIDDPELVKEIKAVFAADWNHIPYHSKSSTLIWSPDNSRKKIMKIIQEAKSKIKIYAQHLNDYEIVGALSKAAKRGVKISILTSNPLNTYQEKYLTKAGIKINYYHRYIIHAKMLMVDDKKVMIGSINFTPNSLDQNRELAIVIDDKAIISQIEKIFNDDWRNASQENPGILSQVGINEMSLIHLLKKLNKALTAAAID